MKTFSPDSGAEGRIMEEIPAGGCKCIWWVISASGIPFFMRTLHMAGLGECNVGPLHSEEEELSEVRLRYAGFRVKGIE